MKHLIYLVSMGAFLVLMAACGDKHGKNYNNEAGPDQNGVVFVKNGIEGGLAEIKASGLAITNSNNQKVIGLAKMMIEDHTKAGDELKKIEADKKIDEKDTLSSAHQQAIAGLSGKAGVAFDRAYLQLMVADHTQAVDLFTTASHNPDSEINAFASKVLPTIKMHLDSANAILSSLK